MQVCESVIHLHFFLICSKSPFSKARHVSELSKFCLVILHFMNFRNSCQMITHSVCSALLWKADYVFPLCICSVCGVICEIKKKSTSRCQWRPLVIRPRLILPSALLQNQGLWFIFRLTNTVYHRAPPCGLKVEPALSLCIWSSRVACGQVEAYIQ